MPVQAPSGCNIKKWQTSAALPDVDEAAAALEEAQLD
jgi:hypothetical protein